MTALSPSPKPTVEISPRLRQALYVGAALALFLLFRQFQVMMQYDWQTIGGGVMLAHSGIALLASLLTVWMLLAPKGTTLHRWAGRTWSVMLLFIALSSFALRDGIGAALGFPLGLGPIHVLSGLAVYSVMTGVIAIRRGNRTRHVQQMVSVCWALLIAGAFTLLPGRFVQQLAFFTL